MNVSKSVRVGTAALAVLLVFQACQAATQSGSSKKSLHARWANSLPAVGTNARALNVDGGAGVYFSGIAVDGQKNVYTVGTAQDSHTYNLGNDQTIAGTAQAGSPVIVKYDAAGNTVWAKTITGGTGNGLQFNAVACDSVGNTYAVGWIHDAVTYTFSDTVSVTGANSTGSAMLVKFDAEGTPLWAKVKDDVVGFNAVCVDSYGACYVAGASKSIFRYSSDGALQWATDSSGTGYGVGFLGIAVDALGNLYAAGELSSNGGTIDFGNNVSATVGQFPKALLVKFNSQGIAQWANSATGTYTYFQGVSCDSSGNIYTAGWTDGATFDFPGCTQDGTASNGPRPLIVKYGADGSQLWAKSIDTVTNSGVYFRGVVSTGDSVYACGTSGDGTTYDFGNGVTTTGSLHSNAVIVRYDSQGTAQSAFSSLSSGDTGATFSNIVTDGQGGIYAVGEDHDQATYQFEDVITSGVGSGYNPLVVKFQ
jgi:hypothetical protein